MNCPVCETAIAGTTAEGGDESRVDCPECGSFRITRRALAMARVIAVEHRKAWLGKAGRQKVPDGLPLMSSYNMQA